MNLDRFSQGFPDPQAANVLAYCESCGLEIYEGEEVYVTHDAILHADEQCLYEYLGVGCMLIEEALGVEV